jgi:hypothetical protein
VPIAVLRPDLTVTLVESHKRKAVFLRESTRNLPNVQVFADRLERNETKHDVAVARAVAWDQIEEEVRGIARHAALLIACGDTAAISGTGGFTWQHPIVVPGGERRVALLGSVPRET